MVLGIASLYNPDCHFTKGLLIKDREKMCLSKDL